MIEDGRRIPDGSVLDADVCIVGAGPAGLALAGELEGRGLAVCLLEAGGLDPDPATADLFDGEPELGPDLYPNIRHLRDTGFGGTARQWCIGIDGRIWMRMARLNPFDYRARDWLPHSGWPIDERTLGPYLLRAMRLAECGTESFDPGPWIEGRERAFAFASDRVEHRLFLFSPQATFTERARDAIGRSRLVRCLLASSAVALETGPDAAAVSAVRVRCLSGNGYRVRARQVVLAQGGFEVPRLLLASNEVAPGGLGNDHDRVGRFLMDHQIVDAGVLRAPDGRLPARAGAYDLQQHAGVHALTTFGLSGRTLEDERILSSAVLMLPRERRSLRRRLQHPFGRGVTWRSPARLALRELRGSVTASGTLRAAVRIAGGLDDLLYHRTRYHRLFRPAFTIDDGGWHAAPDRDRRFDAFDLYLLCEQAPDPGNRITLGADRDALGVPRPRIRFRWNDIDARSAARTQEILAEEFARAGIGKLRYERRDGLPLVTQMSTHHPAGTARMSSNPRDGVVDPDCRVHGVRNLFVASSAVFPTTGYANPTLTIIALALRVADRIASLYPSA